MIEITFKRHWTKIAPFGNYGSRVESVLVQGVELVRDTKVESD